jgi:hypothetical protein
MPSETIWFDKLTWEIVTEYQNEHDDVENASQAVQELVEMGDKMNQVGSDLL